MVRVTSEMMVTSSLRRLSSRLERYELRQSQLASGRRVQRPSDDPSAASRGLALRSAMRARQQELRNADDAVATLDRTDVELQNVLVQVHRARELALRAASSIGDQERTAIAAELREIQSAVVGIANAEQGGRPLFSGFSDNPPVRWDGADWQYDGDAGQLVRRVTEQDRVVVNRTAAQVFGLDGSGDDLFTTLGALADATDPAGVTAALEKLDANRNRIAENLAVVGATTNRVEDARSRTEGAVQVLRGELSAAEDIDLEEAIMNLRVEEVAYEATLAALGRALPGSLVSFLR